MVAQQEVYPVAELSASAPVVVMATERERRDHQTARIAACLSVLWTPGTVTEMAVFNRQGRPVRVGYFDDPAQFARAAMEQAQKPTVGAVYLTPNPVHPDLLSRSCNTTQPVRAGGARTGDAQILARRRFWLDLDPKRLAGIPATDAEHAAAIAKARVVGDYLRDECGFPAATLLDSGNGAYLIYGGDLPNDAETTAAIKACYEAVAARFDDLADVSPRIEIDTSIANPARLTRVIGTMNRKGDESGDRRHRSVKLLETPEHPADITLDMLRAVAGRAPAARAETPTDDDDGAQFTPHRERGRAGESAELDLDRWVGDVLRPWCEAHDRTLSPGKAWQDTGTIWTVDKCFWNPDHAPDKAFVARTPEGWPAAGCQHASCADHKWVALRDLVEPGWRDGQGDPRQPKPRDLTILVELAEANAADFILSTEGQTFALIRDGDKTTVWDVESAEFRGWLTTLFRQREGQVPSANALRDAVSAIANTTLVAKGDDRRTVALRIAGDRPRDPQAIFIDLCDGTQRAIRIDAEGFAVVPGEAVPVLFQTGQGATALPEPLRRDPLLDELQPLLNPGLTPADRILLIAWLVRAACPVGPYWLADLSGEKGSAKSATTKLLRAIIDPNDAPLGMVPHSATDLAVVARHNRIPTFDNMSGVKADMSNMLCMMATEGSIKTRTLYTNGAQFTFKLLRPAILNGISESASKSDLVDRTIRATLPRIAPDKRRAESAFWRDFDARHPFILGALCHALSRALRDLSRIQGEEGERPRMADAWEWVRAAEPALGWESGAFVAAYKAHQEDADKAVLEDDAVANALRELLRRWDNERGNPPAWDATVTVTGLFTKLDECRDTTYIRDDKWPTEPRPQAAFLRLVAPNFTSYGYDVRVLPRSQRSESGQMQARIVKLPQRP